MLTSRRFFSGIVLFFFTLVSSVYAQPSHKTTAVAWNSDGARIAVASSDGRIRLISAVTGITDTEFETVNDSSAHGFTHLAWNPAGDRLATVSLLDGIVRIWDATELSGIKLIAELSPSVIHDDIPLVSWSPTGEYLVGAPLGADGERQIYIWRVIGDTFELLTNLPSGAPYNVIWSDDGTTMIISDTRFLSIAQESEDGFVHTLNFSGFRPDIGLKSDNRTLAAIFRAFTVVNPPPEENDIELYDITSGEVLYTIDNPPDRDLSSVNWLPGDYLIADAFDGGALIWNAQTGELVNELVLPREGGRWLMAVSPFGGRVAFGNAAPDGELRTEGRPLSPGIEVLAGGYVLMAVPLATEEALRGVLGRCAMEPRSADALAAKIDPDAMPAFIAEVEALPPDAMIPACKADVLAVARAMTAEPK